MGDADGRWEREEGDDDDGEAKEKAKRQRQERVRRQKSKDIFFSAAVVLLLEWFLISHSFLKTTRVEDDPIDSSQMDL